MMISTFACLLLALITAHFPANVCGDGEEDLEEGNSHFGHRGESIAHCKSLDFTFLPFTFLPFEDREEDLEEGNSHFGYWEQGEEHCTLQIA